MPSTEVEICNLALSHIGIGKEIGNLETESSEEAAACRRFYDQARDKALRDFAWPFATAYADLGLIEEDPTTEWSFSYQYPTDCVFFRRILSGTRNDTQTSRVPYQIVYDAAGQRIFTDQSNAVGAYTARVEDPTLYPPDFILALSLLLGSLIASRLTKGDQFKKGDKALAAYSRMIEEAEANSNNEQQPENPPESEFIRARD